MNIRKCSNSFVLYVLYLARILENIDELISNMQKQKQIFEKINTMAKMKTGRKNQKKHVCLMSIPCSPVTYAGEHGVVHYSCKPRKTIHARLNAGKNKMAGCAEELEEPDDKKVFFSV